MKINKEQEVVMEVHKQKDSKIHKKSSKKAVKEVAKNGALWQCRATKQARRMSSGTGSSVSRRNR